MNARPCQTAETATKLRDSDRWDVSLYQRINHGINGVFDLANARGITPVPFGGHGDDKSRLIINAKIVDMHGTGT